METTRRAGTASRGRRRSTSTSTSPLGNCGACRRRGGGRRPRGRAAVGCWGPRASRTRDGPRRPRQSPPRPKARRRPRTSRRCPARVLGSFQRARGQPPVTEGTGRAEIPACDRGPALTRGPEVRGDRRQESLLSSQRCRAFP